MNFAQRSPPIRVCICLQLKELVDMKDRYVDGVLNNLVKLSNIYRVKIVITQHTKL